MKVKIIKADGIYSLEKEINNFLKNISDNQIIDIKYQGIGNQAPYSIDCPSAMIIMK